MTRLVHLMAGADIGGAEAFFSRLVPALARGGVAQAAVMRPEPGRVAALEAAGVAVTPARFGGPLDLVSRLKAARAARAARPDAVLAWMSRAAAAMPAGPWVTAARLGGYYDLKYYRRCRHLIGNTRGICRYLVERGWPAADVHYLPNFVAVGADPALPRASLATPEGVPLLLCLGRLHPNKGFDLAIRALARLPDAVLWIAGDGPEGERLRALAREEGVAPRVRFLGWRTDVTALLRAADVFVCSSRHEPLGNMVIEAWAHGVPVVAFDAQGPAELIADGETGLLVPREEVGAFAAAIGAVLADPAAASALADAGHRVYADEFAEPVVVAAYRRFLDKVTGACAA